MSTFLICGSIYIHSNTFLFHLCWLSLLNTLIFFLAELFFLGVAIIKLQISGMKLS